MKKEVIIDEFDFLTGDGYIHGMIYDKCKQILPENTPEIMEGNHSIFHYTHVEGLKTFLKMRICGLLTFNTLMIVKR